MKNDNEVATISLKDAYIKNEKLLLYVAMNVLHNRDCAEDAIQDAMVKIMKYNARITFENEIKAQNFLTRTVKNSAINMYNKNKTTQVTSLDTDPSVIVTADDRTNPEKYSFDNESINDFAAALKAMDPKFSMVLKYLRIDNMTIEQTAEIMEISKRTVSNRYNQAKEILKNMLRKVDEVNE